MILTEQKEANVLTDGESQESIRMSLDMESAQILMQMLSKNLYSDEVGSTVRELASNALDSHRRAKVKKPIIVSFKPNKDSNYEFTVEDFGVGLDDDDVKDIISKYGKSLARDETYSLGMMGLGFKAPLAYTSSFHFIVRKDGIERKYMMYEGEYGNTIDILDTTLSAKPNGVKVIVPVKYGDRAEFVKKIKEQLAYFEDVYFDVPSCSGDRYSYGSYEGVNNGFKIFREKDFQVSEMSNDKSLHICLDNVYYPIDWSKLGINRIDVPVGLRFGLSDGLYPVPSRESLRYTQEAKKAIADKIKKVADYFMEKYNKTITDSDNIENIFAYYSNSSRYVTLNGKSYEVSSLLNYSSIPINVPKLKGVELLNLKSLSDNRDVILNEYRIKIKYNRGKFKECKYEESIHPSSMNGSVYYEYDERIGGVKREYIKSTFSYSNSYYFIRKIKKYSLGNFRTKYDSQNYCSILNLKKHPKSEWRQRIKEFQYIQSLYTDKFIDFDSLQIPQEWLDARKKQRMKIINDNPRRQKLQGEVVGKISQPLERYMEGRNCKFVPETFKLENVYKYPKLIVYTQHDNYLKLDALYEVSKSQKMTFVTFSDREMKNLEKVNIHNLMTYEKFMEGKNRPFERLVTSYLIDKLIKKYDDVFSKRENLETISVNLMNKLKRLVLYRNENYVSGSYGQTELYEAMTEVAEKYSLYDMNIYNVYVEIKTLLEKLTFLQPIMDKIDYRNSETMIPILRDLFKYYKHRIDYKNYRISLNKEEQPVLTEEVVEELTNEV